MSIILPTKAVQILLANKFAEFNESVALILPEVLDAELYGQAAISDWTEYFEQNPVKIKLGWPKEDTVIPALYISAADDNHDETTVGDIEQLRIADDTIATTEAQLYNKSVKIIATSDNQNITLVLSALGEYFIHQEHQWFENFGMSLPKINFQEFDFLSQFWPQSFLYRTFLVTFNTADTIIISKHDTIKGININVDIDLQDPHILH